MEDRRAIISILAISIIFLVIPCPALAYDNADAHLAINQYAIHYLKKHMQDDPYLKNASFDGANVSGIAWDPVDGGTFYDIRSIKRSKTIERWIIDGGYSADEPEIPMALRHFYDPVRIPSFLTDIVNDMYGGDYYINPKMDARTWAISNDTSNLYSFNKGRSYLKEALKSDKNSNENYGKAWRSVGETMHLMADMTVPAHVRNDAHPPNFNPDPYESDVHWNSVKNFNSGDPSKSLQYDCTYGSQTVEKLMYDVAFWTGTNFVSAETIPAGTVSKNGQDSYPNPKISGSPDAEGYYYHYVDGQKVPLVRNTTFSKLGISKEEKYYLDVWVLFNQKKLLIPTAIRASEATLDAFLPRFYVTIGDISPDNINGYMMITGRIDHVLTNEWNEKLIVNNGAHVMVNGRDEEVLSSSYMPDMNMFVESFKASPGDTVQIYYDLGGYKVYSNKYVIPQKPSNNGNNGNATIIATVTTSPTIAPVPKNNTTSVNSTITPTPVTGPRDVFGNPYWSVDHVSVKADNKGAKIQVYAYIVDPSNSKTYNIDAGESRQISTYSYSGTDSSAKFGFFAYENGILIDSIEGTIEFQGPSASPIVSATPTPLPSVSPTVQPTASPIPTTLPEPQLKYFTGYMVDTTLDAYEYHYGLYSASRNTQDPYAEFGYYDLYDHPQLENMLKGSHSYIKEPDGDLRRVVIHGQYKLKQNGVLTMDYNHNLGAYHGTCKDFNAATGMIEFETAYMNGTYHGLRKSYENGYIKSEITYTNGLVEGPFKYYYSKTDSQPYPGRLWQEGSYKNNKKVGLYREYYYNGNKKIECSYIYVTSSWMDTLDGSYVSYYESGQAEHVRSYKNGLLQGQAFYYYTDGSKVYDYNYVNDKLNGLQRSYHYAPVNPALKGKVKYDEMYSDGVFQYRDIYQYDASGNLTGTNRVYDQYQY